MKPPRTWQPQVYNVETVTALDKICPTPLIDVDTYKYLGEVPKAFQPFRVTYTTEGNSDICGAETDTIGYPPNNAAGPFLWTGTSKLYKVNNDDIVEVRGTPLWLSRLVHCYDAYQLKDFRDGNPVTGAPPPGCAPVALTRGEDSWAEKT
ncbi:hypothetical protein MTO96_046037 [Rhipicephalus appendiculatus]